MILLTNDDCVRCDEIKAEFPEIADPSNDAIEELSVSTVDGKVEAAFFDVRAVPALVVNDTEEIDFAVSDIDKIRKTLRARLRGDCDD